MHKWITVGPVDIDLLREQRDALLAYNDGVQPSVDIVEGVVSLLDNMLDNAEDVS